MRWVVLILCGLIALEAVRQAAAQALSRVQPQATLAISPGDAQTAARLSYMRRLSGDAAGARTMALRAVQADPLNVDALSSLGLAQESLGREAEALRVMRFAGDRSWRESDVQAWLLQRDMQSGDVASMARRADSLLRRVNSERSSRPVIALLTMASVLRPDILTPLSERLSLNPRWRLTFLQTLAASPPGEAAVIGLFDRLQRTSAPPTAEEVGIVASQLVGRRRYPQAWRAWTRYGGRGSAAQLRDGAFEGAPDGSPFRWTLTNNAGAIQTVGPAPSGAGEAQALRVDYDGFATPRLANQLLLLGPGTYRLSWREMVGEGDPARLTWKVTCAPTETVLSRSPEASGAGGQGAWRNRTVDFTVPADCPAQWIRLTPSPAERTQPVSVFYTRVNVEGVVAATPAA